MSFMIFVAGASAPQKEHAMEAEARAEAERLSSKNPDRYVYLLELVDVLEPVKHHKWRGRPTTANPQPANPIVIPAPPVSPFAPHPYPPRYPWPPMPDVVYYGCQTSPLGGVITETSYDVTWYGEDADNDD